MKEEIKTAIERFRLAAEILESRDEKYQYKSLETGNWINWDVSEKSLVGDLINQREFRRIPWKLSDELPGFRPLREGERWHRDAVAAKAGRRGR